MHFLGGGVAAVVIERWCKSVATMGNGRVRGAGVRTAPKVPFHERVARASESKKSDAEIVKSNISDVETSRQMLRTAFV